MCQGRHVSLGSNPRLRRPVDPAIGLSRQWPYASIEYPPPTEEELESERGRLGSKQLRALRQRLERNRQTMPLFDTKGWVRDFEKALKIQGEGYATGRSPMHILVARADRLYGTEVVLDLPGGAAAAA